MSRLLALLSVLVVLGGCGGDPPPAAPPEPTASHSETPAAAPVMPEEAKEDSKEGAVAFLGHFIETLNLAQDSGDLGHLRSLSGDQCSGCAWTIKSIASLYRQGGRLEGGDWQTGRYVAAESPTGEWLITMRASYGPQRSFIPGQPVRSFTGGAATYDFAISAFPDRKVLKWSRVS